MCYSSESRSRETGNMPAVGLALVCYGKSSFSKLRIPIQGEVFG